MVGVDQPLIPSVSSCLRVLRVKRRRPYTRSLRLAVTRKTWTNKKEKNFIPDIGLVSDHAKKKNRIAKMQWHCIFAMQSCPRGRKSYSSI